MYHIIYTSESTVSHLSQSDLYHLLAKCRENNSRKKITSVLIHGNGIFLGYMEGAEEAVKETYERIIFDPRHVHCRIITDGEIDGRKFPQLFMAFLDHPDADIIPSECLTTYYLLNHPAEVERIFDDLHNKTDSIEFQYKSADDPDCPERYDVN